MRWLHLTVVCLVIPGLWGCGEVPEAPAVALDDAEFHFSSAIQGGAQDDASKAVIAIVSFANRSFSTCSGTLIAPNVVLTAQHCIAPINSNNYGINCDTDSFGGSYKAEELYVTTTTWLTRDPNNYQGVSQVIVPEEEDGVCGYDIALLILNEPMPESLAVPRTPRVDEPLWGGEMYDAVGYGESSQSAGDSGLRRRRNDLTVDCVESSCSGFQSYYVIGGEWLGEAGVCQGDSGGPAFDKQGRVVGVVSRGGMECSSPIYGHVHSWADWLKSWTKFAASEAGISTPGWALGFATHPKYSYEVGPECTDGTECESGLCYNGTCTRECRDDAPCPPLYGCDDGRGLCISVYDLPVGNSCESPADCGTGLCHNDYCTRPCDEEENVCPSNFTCRADAGYCVRSSELETDDGGCQSIPASSWLWMLMAVACLRWRRRSYAC